MDPKLLFVFGIALLASLAVAENDAFGNYEEDESKEEEVSNDEGPRALELQNDDNEGLCRYNIKHWLKLEESVRCGCLQCTCKSGGTWECAYNFNYCPFFYCGNEVYNPNSQLCCCGKVHDKKQDHACCGHFYYDLRHSKCCNYYSVKSKSADCPRYKI